MAKLHLKIHEKTIPLIFFPGKHSLDVLGASRVIAHNLFPMSSADEVGTVIGMGSMQEYNSSKRKLRQIDLRPKYLRKALPYRAVSKTNRSIGRDGRFHFIISSWVEYKLDILADSLAAEQIKMHFHNDSSSNIAIGLSSMSLAFGHAAKAAGKRFALHSQWCHPFTQNALISEAYQSLKLAPPSFSKSKINRQIKEYELADLIWCPSNFVRESLINNGVPKEKTFVAHLGVNVSNFKTEENSRSTSDPFLILFVGRICVQKGVHVLLEALLDADITNTVMVFNGVADHTAKLLLQEYDARLANKNIIVRIDPGDPRRYHKKASVFVLPSIHDAFGIVIPEAMAAGLPIIVSTNVGAKECLKHGVNGFVFPTGNSHQLAEYIEFFFRNPASRIEFGRVSSDIAQCYDLHFTNKKFLAAFE